MDANLKIAFLEDVNLTSTQKARLSEIGQIDYFNLSHDDLKIASQIAPNYDIVAVNWIDPSSFIMQMKPNSLIALMYTGYGYIQNISEAKTKGVSVANLTNYSTEAVAEHLLGLLIGITKRIFPEIANSGEKIMGFELKNKTVGIIGLGNIGMRFAEMMNFFGAKVITTNRHNKNSSLALDVSLSECLRSSDILCVSCSLNDDSKGLINLDNVDEIKKGAILISCDWYVFDAPALAKALETEIISFAGIDANIDLSREIKLDDRLQKYRNKTLFLTQWNAYNTQETEANQMEMLCNNIISFAKGFPINIV